MSGFDTQKGKLQYIRGKRLTNNDKEELIVVTSGSGGIFKSGIPIGKINTSNILNDSEIVVNFYRDFSQLKYIKILSNKKKKIKLDENNKIIFDTNDEIISVINNQIKNINILQQQNLIIEEIRAKLKDENIKLNTKLINTQKELDEKNKKIIKVQIDKEEVRFLKLNLLHGHKCRKTFFKQNLYKINSSEYKNCVLNKE
jgi:rod shape-determining protein MreC